MNPEIDAIVRRALAEDIGDGDVTTLCTIEADARVRGRLLAGSRPPRGRVSSSRSWSGA